MRTLSAALLLFAAAGSTAQAQQGRIMRPVDGAALPSGEVEVIARAPGGGRIEIDGKPVEAAEPFDGVLHAKASVPEGEHTLAVAWDGDRKEIKIFVGPNPPQAYKTFQPHPPLAGVECTQCHSISSRGRFRFSGGCFDCHTEDAFNAAHAHPNAMHLLKECGLCHNAHGSTTKAHMLYPKEVACKQCHN